MFSIFKKQKPKQENVDVDDPGVPCPSVTSKNAIAINDLGTLSTGPSRPILAVSILNFNLFFFY